MADDNPFAQFGASQIASQPQPFVSPAPSVPTTSTSSDNLFAQFDKAPKPTEQPRLPDQGAAHEFAGSAVNALTFNLARPIQAWIDYETGQGGSSSYGEAFNKLKTQDEASATAHPWASEAGMVTGALGTMALPGVGPLLGRLSTGATVLGTAAKSALTSGVTSGISGLAESGDIGQAGKEALWGAGIGSILGPIFQGTAGLLAKNSILDANGNLSPFAMKAVQQAGIDPNTLTPDVIVRIAKTFTDKGVSPYAAREAMLGEFGLTPTRGEAMANPKAIYQEKELPEVQAMKGPGGEREAELKASQATVAPANVTGNVYDKFGNVISRTQSARDRDYRIANAAYESLYSEPGMFDINAARATPDVIKANMAARRQWVDLNGNATPKARAALNMLEDTLGGQNIGLMNALGNNPNPANIAEINFEGIDQARKNLNSIMSGTTDPNDMRLLNIIKNEFDQHVDNMMTNGYFSGDSDALRDGITRARTLYSDYMDKYGIQQTGDTAGGIMKKIINDPNMNAQKLASYFMNKTDVGSQGISTELYSRLKDALGSDIKPLNDALLQRLVTPKPERTQVPSQTQAGQVATRIETFLKVPLSNLAFDPGTINQLKRYAYGLRAISLGGSPGGGSNMFRLAASVGLKGALTGGAIYAGHMFGGVPGAAAAGMAEKMLEPIGEKIATAMKTKAAMAGAPTVQPARSAAGVAAPVAQYMARAKGGRIEANKLGREVESIRKNLGGALEPLTKVPDEIIVHALRLAKG